MSAANPKVASTECDAIETQIPDPNTTMKLPTTLGATTCGTESSSPSQPCGNGAEEQIRELAHAKWEAAGCPAGDGLDFWLEAEREFLKKSGLTVKPKNSN